MSNKQNKVQQSQKGSTPANKNTPNDNKRQPKRDTPIPPRNNTNSAASGRDFVPNPSYEPLDDSVERKEIEAVYASIESLTVTIVSQIKLITEFPLLGSIASIIISNSRVVLRENKVNKSKMSWPRNNNTEQKFKLPSTTSKTLGNLLLQLLVLNEMC
jgi:hypothetical protein